MVTRKFKQDLLDMDYNKSSKTFLKEKG